MSERPTISVYLDDHIADVGYYRNWSGVGLLWECCDLAKRLDGSRTYQEVQERLGKLSEDKGFPPSPELDPEFDAPEEDRKLTQMLAPMSRAGGHHPDEELMLELESCSEFPIFIDLTRRCFYYGGGDYDKSGFRAGDVRLVGWREWIEDNGAETGYRGSYDTFYDYWAAPGMAVSLDDADDLAAWLEADRETIKAVREADVSPIELVRLARQDDPYVRACIAQTTSDKGILFMLAKDPVAWVREVVAQNEGAPEELLRALAADEVASVRLSVGLRHEVPESVQRMLAQDGDPEFRKKLARDAMSDGLLLLLAHDAEEIVRKSIARNIGVPDDVLMTLAQDESASVRLALANSFFLPEEVLRVLTQDEDPEVRSAATLMAKRRQRHLDLLSGDEDEWYD